MKDELAMNLTDALNLIKRPVGDDTQEFGIFVASGFTPLHLQTYLHAYLRQRFPLSNIKFGIGIFGDLAGNLQRAQGVEYDFAVVAIEWSDIDARLGIRNLGNWRTDALPDLLQSAERQLERLKQSIAGLAAQTPCVVALPTLPLPPIFPQKVNQSGQEETCLRRVVANFASSLCGLSKVRLLSGQALDEASPLSDRHDIRSEIMSGFPYTLSHAETLARLLAELIENPSPKKGLVTDLDDTLWLGILGEIGIEKICWDLAGHALSHGLYQQFLESLASAGVLLAVASKNDTALANSALERRDILIPKSSFFPIECHWSSKSESVGRILKTWNISADAVVFVDDSPMEVAEVQAAFPELDCRIFPKNDPHEVVQLLRGLRNCFGKAHLTQEDSFRLESIRSSSGLQELTVHDIESQDEFLKGAKALIVFEADQTEDARVFELINKTNQFNLNGRRLTQADWTRYFSDANAFLLSVQYEDKYGRLGKIAALVGKRTGDRIFVDFWVMSCRAFSRRIEHHCLKYLFEKFQAREAIFAYQATERNGPLQEFFAEMSAIPLTSPIQMRRERCLPRLPHLFHRVQETIHD
jgi:FkbH-like protein